MLSSARLLSTRTRKFSCLYMDSVECREAWIMKSLLLIHRTEGGVALTPPKWLTSKTAVIRRCEWKIWVHEIVVDVSPSWAYHMPCGKPPVSFCVRSAWSIVKRCDVNLLVAITWGRYEFRCCCFSGNLPSPPLWDGHSARTTRDCRVVVQHDNVFFSEVRSLSDLCW